MRAIKTITEKLKKYPFLEYKIEVDMITVESETPSGFEVWLSENNPWHTVGFDGWHEEFTGEEEALNCFVFGLSDDYRLYRAASRKYFSHFNFSTFSHFFGSRSRQVKRGVRKKMNET